MDDDVYLVAQALGSNDGDFIADTLVSLEVEGQAWVVALNEHLCRLLDSLGTDATHFGGVDEEEMWSLGRKGAGWWKDARRSNQKRVRQKCVVLVLRKAWLAGSPDPLVASGSNSSTVPDHWQSMSSLAVIYFQFLPQALP